MDAYNDRPGDRRDPWQASLDRLDDLRRRLEPAGDLENDEVARRLMAEVELDRTTSFIVLLRRDGAVLDVNPGALLAGGIERDEVIGSLLWHTPWWRESPRAQDETAEAFQGVVRQGTFARFDVDAWIEAAGTARGTLDLSLRPLRGRDGMVTLVLADGRNVTDRTKAERRITRQHAEVTVLNDRLGTLVEHHRRLIGNLSHDLRMPIQLVLTRTDRMLELAQDPALQAEIRAVRLAAENALAQMGSMLEQARSGESEDRLHATDGDLAAAVRSVAEEFSPLAERRGVTIELDVPERLRAAFDAERVSRIVANLLANAVRYSPEDGIVRCSLVVHGPLAHLEVADSGPGIPPSERKAIFERFAAGSDHRAQTGLGLAIVHEFVALHGGTVSVDSAPEGGALFVVTLPLDASGPVEAPTLAQQVAAARQAALVRTELEAALALPPEPDGLPAVLYVGGRREVLERIRAALRGRATVSGRDVVEEGLEHAIAQEVPMVVLDHDVSPSALGRLSREGHRSPYVVALAEPGTARWRKLHMGGAHAVLTLPELERRAVALLEHERRHRARAGADASPTRP